MWHSQMESSSLINVFIIIIIISCIMTFLTYQETCGEFAYCTQLRELVVTLVHMRKLKLVYLHWNQLLKYLKHMLLPFIYF